MIPLFDYMLMESNGTSDDALLYRQGVITINAMNPAAARRTIKNYRINKNDPRPGVLRYAHDKLQPIPDGANEVIPRSQWDMDSITGVTEAQLMHPAYHKVMSHYFRNNKKKHDLLTVFQCSAKKPYTDNFRYKLFQKYAGDFSDFACMSSPGIIPFSVCELYPFRYDEYAPMEEEKLDEMVDMFGKYFIVNACRAVHFVKMMHYKHVFVICPYERRRVIYDEILRTNAGNAKDWLVILTDDTLRNNIKKSYPKLKDNPGVLTQRIWTTPPLHNRYAKEMRKLLSGDDLKKFDELFKEYHPTRTNESVTESIDAAMMEEWMEDTFDMIAESFDTKDLIKENPTIHDTLDYQSFIKKFKDHIKDNMENPDVDKGKNNKYYKSYYWTALDLMIMAMDGDLVDDVDIEYQRFIDKLVKDEDFEHIGGFLFAYKPLLKNDKLSIHKIEREAKDMGLLKDGKTPIKIIPNLFN